MLRAYAQSTDRLATEIVFGILRYVYLKVNSESLALGFAKSIWRSMGTNVAKHDDELSDEAGDWLLTDPNALDNRSKPLQLDGTHDGSVAQFWLIDRIMRGGFSLDWSLW